MDGLNDLRPHVVHFSGHAGEVLLFDTADPTTPGDQLVGYQHVASLGWPPTQPPTLIVLNACSTANGVEDMLQVVERRRGERIAAKGIYRNPVRSSDSHIVK